LELAEQVVLLLPVIVQTAVMVAQVELLKSILQGSQVRLYIARVEILDLEAQPAVVLQGKASHVS
jgi:hypothetical protein